MTMEQDIQQQTDQWKLLRLGKVTASRVAEILPSLKSGKYLKSREDYLNECVMGRFGISAEPQYVSKAMERGVDCEGFARSKYEERHNLMVEQISFVDHPFISNSGASPDGLVNGTGLLEIKCPNSSTHFDYIIDPVIPEQYKPQMAWQMACTGASYCDFVSFDDRCPEGLQYFEIRYEREEDYIKMLEVEVAKFVNEVTLKYEILKAKILK